jgi:hypothetical protein
MVRESSKLHVKMENNGSVVGPRLGRLVGLALHSVLGGGGLQRLGVCLALLRFEILG